MSGLMLKTRGACKEKSGLSTWRSATDALELSNTAQILRKDPGLND